MQMGEEKGEMRRSGGGHYQHQSSFLSIPPYHKPYKHPPLSPSSHPPPSSHYFQLNLWSPYIKALISWCSEVESHDILWDFIGIISNFTPLDFPSDYHWMKACNDFGILSLLLKLLVPGLSQPDVVMSSLLLLHTLLSECEMMFMVLDTPLLHTLLDVWSDTVSACHDLDVVIILCSILSKLLSHSSSRQEIMNGPCKLVISDMLSLLHHPSQHVWMMMRMMRRKKRSEMGVFGKQVRDAMFKAHNS